MSYTMYTPLNVWLDPASVTDVVAYIQNYLSENTIYSEEEIEELIHDYLIAHPELIGGVQSVNGKTGTVVLSASDINTQNNVTIESVLSSLSSQISSIAASVATNTSNITSLTGRVTTAETDISNLKSSLNYIVTPQMFGALGNGESSQTVDQKAFEDLAASLYETPTGDYSTIGRLNVVHIPAGDYYISNISFPSGCIIYGDGWNTRLHCRGDYAIGINRGDTSPITFVSSINFRDGYQTTTGCGLYILNRTQVKVDNCWFGSNYGLNIQGSYEVDLNQCIFDLCAVAITSTGGSGNRLNNCEFYGVTNQILVYSNVDSSLFNNLFISSCVDGCSFANCDNLIFDKILRRDSTNKNYSKAGWALNTCSNIMFKNVIHNTRGGKDFLIVDCDKINLIDVLIDKSSVSNSTGAIKASNTKTINLVRVSVNESGTLAPFILSNGSTGILEECVYYGNGNNSEPSAEGGIFCINTNPSNVKMIRCSTASDSAYCVGAVRYGTLNMYDCEFTGTYTTKYKTYNNAVINDRQTPIAS